MRRAVIAALLGALPLGLAACGASSAGSPGGRPSLPTGAEVRFPTAPAGSYLNLMTDAGTSVYQVSVPAGATVVEVDPLKWAGTSTQAVAVESLVPAGATGVTVSAPGTKVLLLHWVMWQDRDSDGARDVGEDLALMSHDRVAYAAAAVTVAFATATPDMQQTWTLGAGWSRAEHFVFLPSGSTTYRRTLSTATPNRTTLHVPTPVTSQ